MKEAEDYFAAQAKKRLTREVWNKRFKGKIRDDIQERINKMLEMKINEVLKILCIEGNSCYDCDFNEGDFSVLCNPSQCQSGYASNIKPCIFKVIKE